jgi:hypothetical protein
MNDIYVNSKTKLHPGITRKEAVRAYYAMRELLEKAENELAAIRASAADIDKAVDVQLTDGNWNYDPYMHGMANGLLFAQACLRDTTPEYLDAPTLWKGDKHNQ